MKIDPKVRSLSLLIPLLLVAGAATIKAATVQNGDFSSPSVGGTYDSTVPTDFTGEAGFSGGTITSGFYPALTYSQSQFLYLQPNANIVEGVNTGGTGGINGIYQDLGALQPLTLYTVTVAESAGSSSSGGTYGAATSTFVLDLYNGTDTSTTPVNTTDTVLSPAITGDGSFTDETVTFTTGAAVSGDLTLGLSSFDAVTQTSVQDFFANVRLTSTPATTPEPSTYALVLGGLGALVLLARLRRQA